MKKYVLMIIFCFLPIIVFGHKEDDTKKFINGKPPDGKHSVYRWETKTGNKWKYFGTKGLQDYYEGEFENGNFHGLGTIWLKDGGFYSGEWDKGNLHGIGIYKWKNEGEEFKYSGEFVENEFSGKGKFENKNYIFEGDFKNDERNGWGKETNKHLKFYYEGEWKDGRKHGKGKYVSGKTNRIVIEGEWKDGENWNTKRMDEEGNIIEEYIDGVEQE